MEHIYAVIMAGGGGTRLWPISRKIHPKHLLPLIGENTLFQRTLNRLKDFIPPENIYVVTTAEQEWELKKQAPLIPNGNFLIEPMPRGTASVVGFAAAILIQRDPDAIMIVLPCDHFIRNIDQFYKVIRVAIQVANNGYLVTLGITPSFPATGYGYIQQSTVLSDTYDLPVYRVLHFTEKPNLEQARVMLTGNNYSWNSGIFIWRVESILEEIGGQMPDLKNSIDQIGASWGTLKQQKVLDTIWPSLNPETIDYGIMEHAVNVAVLQADGLEWSDIGSWDSIFDVLQANEEGNIVVNANHIPINTHNTLIFSSGMRLIATIDLNDLIIVDSDDALLVCHRNQSQDVRQVIEKLKKDHKNQFL